jgi:hypothetical protein
VLSHDHDGERTRARDPGKPIIVHIQRVVGGLDVCVEIRITAARPGHDLPVGFAGAKIGPGSAIVACPRVIVMCFLRPEGKVGDLEVGRSNLGIRPSPAGASVERTSNAVIATLPTGSKTEWTTIDASRCGPRRRQ